MNLNFYTVARPVFYRTYSPYRDGVFEVGLLPVQFQLIYGAESFDGDMEERNLKLMVKGSLGVFVEGLGLCPDRADEIDAFV